MSKSNLEARDQKGLFRQTYPYIETTEELLSSDQLPSWFKYPEPLLNLVRHKNIDFGLWQILLSKWLEVRLTGLRQRYPERNLIPFARRMDCDDVACFDVQKQAEKPSVVIIHDFASSGWEMRSEFEDFEQWLDTAKADAKEWGL